MSFDQLMDGAIPPHKNNPMNNLEPKDLVKILNVQMKTKKNAEMNEKLDN